MGVYPEIFGDKPSRHWNMNDFRQARRRRRRTEGLTQDSKRLVLNYP